MNRLVPYLCVPFLIFGSISGYAAESTEKPIRMAYLQNDLHHLALWVAMEQGFFKHENIPVEIAGVFKAGPEIMTAFAAGALDMAYVGEAPATTAVANKTTDVVAVAQVNTDGSALVVSSRNSGIDSIADLAGKTVAVPGHSTVQDLLLRKALARHGLDDRQVNIMVLKPPEMIPALRTGQIHAFIAWETFPSKAVTLEIGRILATSKDIWADHPCCVLVSDRKFLESNRDRVAAVVRAHVNATDFIRSNPDEAVQIAVKYTGTDEETVRLALRNVHFTYILSVEGEKEYVEFLSDLKYIRVPDVDIFLKSFMDSDLLEAILKSP